MAKDAIEFINKTNRMPVLNKLKFSQLSSDIKSVCVFGIKADHVMLSTRSDDVYAYGNNANGCLGLGITATTVTVITPVQPLCNQQVIDFVFGFNHVIALTKTGELYTWGGNTNGELGNGSLISSYVPKICRDLRGKQVTKVCCGAYHNIALTSSGQLYCWGLNSFGQIGNHTNESPQRTPIDISAAIESKIVAIACGRYFSLALTETGVVYSWGSNEFGQLGVGYNRHQCVPTCIVNLIDTDIKDIACGPSHAMLLSRDGEIYSFGYNYFGSLGIGNRVSQNTPQKLKTTRKCVSIALSIYNDLSAAKFESSNANDDTQYLVWGKCIVDDYEHIFCEPKPNSHFNSFHDIFIAYSQLKVTYKPIIFEDNQ